MVYDMNREEVLNLLQAHAKESHKLFVISVINTMDPDRIIGIPTAKIREIARDMVVNDSWHKFVDDLPHYFFEENQLHAFIIDEIRNFDTVIKLVKKFLPYIDNWATCDQMSPSAFKENPQKIMPYIEKWIVSKKPYTVRFAIVCLMRYFMEDLFDEQYVEMVVNIKSKEYIVNMAMAWYFSTAAAKQFDCVLPYFNYLDEWTRKRAIEKAIESYRVSGAHKLQLKKLKKRVRSEKFYRNHRKSEVDI